MSYDDWLCTPPDDPEPMECPSCGAEAFVGCECESCGYDLPTESELREDAAISAAEARLDEERC